MPQALANLYPQLVVSGSSSEASESTLKRLGAFTDINRRAPILTGYFDSDVLLPAHNVLLSLYSTSTEPEATPQTHALEQLASLTNVRGDAVIFDIALSTSTHLSLLECKSHFDTTAGTALSSETKDGLRPRIAAMLEDAEYEDLEIGVASPLTRGMSKVIIEYGPASIEALYETLETRLPSTAVVSVLLRYLGGVQDRRTHRYRRELLTNLLRSSSVQVRHAASAGLAELDDPKPYLI